MSKNMFMPAQSAYLRNSISSAAHSRNRLDQHHSNQSHQPSPSRPSLPPTVNPLRVVPVLLLPLLLSLLFYFILFLLFYFFLACSSFQCSCFSVFTCPPFCSFSSYSPPFLLFDFRPPLFLLLFFLLTLVQPFEVSDLHPKNSYDPSKKYIVSETSEAKHFLDRPTDRRESKSRTDG